MTLKQAKAQLRAIGITINKTRHGEYRVNFTNGYEATASYQDDLESAVATGIAMSKRKWNPGPSASMPEVWVASGWFSGNDPFFSMAFNPARFTKLQASKKFNRELNQTAVDMWRGGDWGMTKSEFLSSLAWSGMHLMNTGDVVSGSRYEQEEVYDDLAKRGYAYLVTN
jgi:hypothetical protein